MYGMGGSCEATYNCLFKNIRGGEHSTCWRKVLTAQKSERSLLLVQTPGTVQSRCLSKLRIYLLEVIKEAFE